MADPRNVDRRRALGAGLSLLAVVAAPKARAQPASFGPLKQIDAGVLNVGYAEAGPANGTPVLLLHGWPYDIHTYSGRQPLENGSVMSAYGDSGPRSGRGVHRTLPAAVKPQSRRSRRVRPKC